MSNHHSTAQRRQRTPPPHLRPDVSSIPTSPIRPPALMFAYRRLLAAVLSVPLVSLLFPPLSLLSLDLANRLTRNHGILWSIATVGLMMCAKHLIRIHAPSEKAAEDALRKCRGVRFPLLVGLMMAMVCRMVVHPLWEWAFPNQAGKGTGGWDGSVAILWLGMRVAAGTAVLGAVVAMRFVGPVSIVRCSPTPLQNNPFAQTIQSLWIRCSSIDTFLDMIAGPDPTKPRTPPQSQLSWHGAERNARGRRFERPPFMRCVFQIVPHALGGMALAYVTILPIIPTEGAGEVATVASILSMFMGLSLCLDGKSHELKPKYHHLSGMFVDETFDWRSVSRELGQQLRRSSGSILPYMVCTPLVSYFLVYLSKSDAKTGVPLSVLLGSMATNIVISYGVTIVVTVYTLFLDTIVRGVLCAPGVDIDRVVYESSNRRNSVDGTDDSGTTTLLAEDVIISSVLLGSVGVIRDVVPSRAFIGVYGADIEEEEVRRNDAVMELMAEVLLNNSLNETESLEDDVLRIALLESLGGDGGLVVDGLPEGMGSPRHCRAIRHRLEISERVLGLSAGMDGRKGGGQPFAVPIVRALCAYAGGLGESLVRCTTTGNASWQKEQGRRPSRQISMVENYWSLPSGATACAEYAILAAARFVVLNFTFIPGQQPASRRHTRMALLIPSVLHTAYRLRCGAICHAQFLAAGADASLLKQGIGSPLSPGRQVQQLSAPNLDDLGNFIAVKCPELRPVLFACDDAAVMILRTVEGMKDVEIKLQSGCQQWLNGLRDRI